MPALRLAAVQSLTRSGRPAQCRAGARDRRRRPRRARCGRSCAVDSWGPSVAAALRGRRQGKVAAGGRFTEKMAMFETYGALGGEAGIPLLNDILNSRGFLGHEKQRNSGLRGNGAGKDRDRRALSCHFGVATTRRKSSCATRSTRPCAAWGLVTIPRPSDGSHAGAPQWAPTGSH